MESERPFEHARATVYLVLTALLWSTGGVLVKWIDWNAPAIAGARCVLATGVLGLIVRRRHLTFSGAQIAGAIGYAATVILYVAATKMTTAANAILLQYTAPVYVALLSTWILHERIGLKDLFFLFMAMAGLVFFFLDRLSPGYFRGNLLAILSGMAFAVMIVAMRKQKSAFPLGSIFLGNILVVILTAPFLISPPPQDGRSRLALLFLGLFQLGFSYVLYSAAIRYVTALEAIMVPILEPVLNPVWVFLLVGEQPGPWAVLGGTVVLVSIVSYMLTRSRKEAAL